MNRSELVVAYPEGGEKVRTIYQGDEVLFCLADTVRVLAAQNIKLATGKRSEGLFGLVKAQMDVLEKDEVVFVGESDEDVSARSDLHYITQPGLFRLILRDTSPACKRFQRWVLHEVLPSIQKYGTYPPPVATQNSQLKQVVQSLLAEIEERERLEEETKDRFSRHEQRLNELSDSIASQHSHDDGAVYLSVRDYCCANGVGSTQEHRVFGWCLKICAEGGGYSKKRLVNGEETVMFPEYVLQKAAREAGVPETDKLAEAIENRQA